MKKTAGERLDRWALVLLVLGAVGLACWRWLAAHPQHDPWSPLRLDDPPGWATARKLVRLRDNPGECRAFLTRNQIAFTALPPVGEGTCRREDRTVLSADAASGLSLRPAGAQASCAVNAGLALWLHEGVQPAAKRLLGSRVVTLEHYGTNSCRRIGGGDGGSWSEHATGNAIDIAAFVLADGRRVTVRGDWGRGDRSGASSNRGNERAAFLHAVRDAACGTFGTVLSPDYNAAHADHVHFDQAGSGRGWSFCR